LGEVVTQVIQLRIRWRDDIRIKSSQLRLAFPLVTGEIVGRRKRQRNQSQNYRDAPKDYRLAPEVNLWREMRKRREESDSAGERRSDKADGHLLERPVVKKIQGREKENLSANEDCEADKKPAVHVRAVGSAACIASSA
jgi:hypothetical protein